MRLEDQVLTVLLPLLGWSAAKETSASTAAAKAPAGLDNFVCNNGTAFACHCATASEEALRSLPTCYGLIQGSNLSVIRLRATELTLSEKLPPKEEDYEAYFKRKLANVVTRHCAKDAHKCPKLGLEVKPDSVVILKRKDLRRVMSAKVRKRRLCRSAGVGDPVRAVSQVLCLSLACQAHPSKAQEKVRCVGGTSNETELLLTILRSKEETTLNATTAMSAWSLLEVLRAEKETLNRVFGPATITELRILTLSFQHPRGYWWSVYEQNKHLIWALLVISALLILIYVLAVAKLLVLSVQFCRNGCRLHPKSSPAHVYRCRDEEGVADKDEEEMGLRGVTAAAKRQDGAFKKSSSRTKVASYGATEPPPPLRRPSELLTRDSIDGMAVRPPSSSPKEPSAKSLPRSRSSASSLSSSASSRRRAASSRDSPDPPRHTVVEVQHSGDAETSLSRRPAPPPPAPGASQSPPPEDAFETNFCQPPPEAGFEADFSQPPPPAQGEISPESTPPPTPDEEPFIAPEDLPPPPPLPPAEPDVPSPESTPPPVPEEEPYIASSSPEQLNLMLAAPVPPADGGETSAYEETSDTDTEAGLPPQGPLRAASLSSDAPSPVPPPVRPPPCKALPVSSVQIRVVSPAESPKSELSPAEEAKPPPEALPHSSDEETVPLQSPSEPTPKPKASPLAPALVNGGSSAEDDGASTEDEDSGSELPGRHMDYHRLQESNWSINRVGSPASNEPPAAAKEAGEAKDSPPALAQTSVQEDPDQAYSSSSPDLR